MLSLRQLRGGPPAGKEEVRLYHDQLLAAYRSGTIKEANLRP